MAGEYLASADFEARGGRGDFTTTKDITNALKFSTPNEAFLFWKTRSKTVPTRPDGKPNRPLTMLHAEFMDADTPRAVDTPSRSEVPNQAGRRTASATPKNCFT